MNRENLQRIAMVIEFDGKPFHGWQQQDNAVSVQAEMQRALASIDGQSIKTVAAGRTDTGVHAEAFLLHADVCTERWNRSHRAYVHGCNSLLPDAIRVTGVRAVEKRFHARFDCRERCYRYQIWNRTTASALEAWRHWWMPRPLDFDAMSEAAAICLGKHDFSALRAANCQASSSVRTINAIRVEQHGHCIALHISADAFLYHMVRNLVGNLVAVGVGRFSPKEFSELLLSGDRTKGAATAPAWGLYFTDAIYDNFRASDLIGGL